MTAYSNAQFTTALGNFHTATGLAYGGYTRVGNLDTDYDIDPNGDMAVLVRSSITDPATGNGVEFHITYNQLIDSNRQPAIDIIESAHAINGVHGNLLQISTIVNALADYIASDGLPFANATYKNVVESLRLIHEAQGQPAWKGWFDAPPGVRAGQDARVNASFTDSDQGGAETDLTSTSTGDYRLLVWNLNDGEATYEGETVSHTFSGGAGTYSVTLRAIGPGGVDEVTQNVTVTA